MSECDFCFADGVPYHCAGEDVGDDTGRDASEDAPGPCPWPLPLPPEDGPCLDPTESKPSHGAGLVVIAMSMGMMVSVCGMAHAHDEGPLVHSSVQLGRHTGCDCMVILGQDRAPSGEGRGYCGHQSRRESTPNTRSIALLSTRSTALLEHKAKIVHIRVIMRDCSYQGYNERLFISGLC